MKAERLGDRAVIIRELHRQAPSIESVRSQWPSCCDVVEAFGVVALYFESEAPDPELMLREWSDFGPTSPNQSRLHTIPICYELGPDFESVCKLLNMDSTSFIEAHSSAEYRVEAIGFSPGFPYMSGLPKEIQGLTRLASPRQRVEAGSIGIIEDLCGIYPQATPGGWNLIGRTPISIVDLESEFFRFSVGDTVRFEPIDQVAFAAWTGD